ncbi:MAG: hypothetical protein Q8K60_07335 [Parachlamydiaceae bacterium]|nr:hypothetical protein [Parachlamydiaceae bacterium]
MTNQTFFSHIFNAIFLISIFYQASYRAEELKKTEITNSVDQQLIDSYILPKSHPLFNRLKKIFNQPSMFKSTEHFEKAGFNIKLGHRKLMVGAHPSIKSYLFKKFPNSYPQQKQLDNFITRIKGAEILRKCIAILKLKHIVVPKKWLYKLPKSFSREKHEDTYLLVVENMDIYEGYENPQDQGSLHYYNMNIEVLTELCTLLHFVGGCDAYPRNQPFTKSGKIAFVDTEHIGKLKGHFLKHIVPALNPDLQPYAVALWMKLEQEGNN